MVSVVLTDLVHDASSLQLVLGGFVATILAYKLLFPTLAPHEAYAKKHGLKHIKLAKRLPTSRFLLGDTLEVIHNMPRLFDWILEKSLEMDEQPWLRHVPSMPDSIMISSPALVQDVVQTQNDTFDKGDMTRSVFKEVFGHGLFVLEGDAWYHQRKIATTFFSTQMYRDVATPVINKHVDVLLAVLEKACGSSEPVDLTKLFHEFTLQAISELGFGLKMNLMGNKDGHPFNDAIDGVLDQALYRWQMPMWVWKLQRLLDVGSERKNCQATRKVHRIVSDRIYETLMQAQSKSGLSRQPTNMVELFVHAMQDDPAETVSPERLRDVAIMFVFGGRDTPASAFNWFFLMLHKHPDVEQKLRKELWDKAPALMRGETKTLTMDQTQTLPYLDAVIKETLRLHSPGPVCQREANRDTHLVDGTFVAKGATVGMSPYVMGRLQSIWGEDALEFKPERFVDAATGKLRAVSPFELFSFHAGPRDCIATHVAMLEIKLLIATLLSRFRLNVLPNDGSYKKALTLQLKNPLMARIQRANATAY